MADGSIFNWDFANVEHIRRHRLAPSEVEQLFDNDPVEIDFDVADGEHRWTAVGHSGALRYLVVVFTIREGAIRPITARTANRRERAEYLKAKGL